MSRFAAEAVWKENLEFMKKSASGTSILGILPPSVCMDFFNEKCKISKYRVFDSKIL